MISWTDFWLFALPAFCCWLAGAWFAWRGNRIAKACGFTLAGLLIFAAFIIGLWVSLERPPMRTMGETRLWYSFFLPLVGLMTYLRWRYKWILSFSTVLALVFIGVNLLKPDIHNKNLMPALQSPWFVPHVIVYMFAYAMLGAATVMALYLLLRKNKRPAAMEMDMCDNLVQIGFSFMTLGLLSGALWAKEAWGHYWSWDPKETWAAITWFCYLSYIHYRLHRKTSYSIALIMLLISFVAFVVRSASARTSSATTANPRPCSPARAASIAALRASKFV